MYLPFDVEHFFRPDASKAERALALRAALDLLIDLNMIYLKYHPTEVGLYQSGVVYGRTQEWDPIPALYPRRFGDCKSLACALIAQYRMRGIAAEPSFRYMPPFFKGTKLEYTLFHILVRTATGYEDPSKELGMGVKDLQPFYATDGSIEQYEADTGFIQR